MLCSMAVAHLCPRKEWAKWRREIEKNRRRKWLRYCARVGVRNEKQEEEDDAEGEEAEVSDSDEEEGNTDEENGADDGREEEEDEEMEMTEAEEVVEGENEVERGVKEIKNGGEEDMEATEANEWVDVEKENKVDEDEEKEVMKAEELEEGEEEGENEAEIKVKEETNQDEEEDSDVKETTEMEEDQEEGEKVVERAVVENEEVDAEEEREVTEAEEVEEEEMEAANEVERDVKEYWEVDEVEEKEVTEEEEMEEEQEEEEHEFERDVNEGVDEEEDRHVREDEQVKEKDDEEGENQEQEQVGPHQQMRRTEDENIQQNQESTRREDEAVYEEENVPDSAESGSEDSDLTGYEDDCYNFERTEDEDVEKQYKDPEELDDPDEKPWRNENSITEAAQERKEDASGKLTDEEEAGAESWTTQEELFEREEEESTDDEEAKDSADENTDDGYEDVVSIYCKDDHLTDLFGTLTEFRYSSLLTDLTLNTEDGKSFHVHSPVLAAVSSFIRERLSRSNGENSRADERIDGGVNSWSVSVGPEVDHVGLEAIVEFAYTGLISCLHKDTVHQIKAAAHTLGAPRVLDLCTKEEQKSTKTGEQKKEEKISAEEQMMISLQSIRQLWMDKVGCDVVLEALGGSFHVHRVILAVWSNYFRSMFTLGMRESHQSCVTLPFLLASELEVLIDCSYSGALPLSWRCVFELTITALQLQFQPALSLCLKFLKQEINPHSCLDVASFAEAYEMAQLLEVAHDFVLRQFQKVACTKKFKDLPAMQLLRYLNSHSLCVPSELVVFKAVVAWIQAKPRMRMRLAKELMKTIHFPLMTFKEFKEVQSLDMWSDHSLEKLYEAIFEDFCASETEPQSQCRIYLPKESLVLIGGDQTFEDLGSRSISRELWFGNSLRNHTGIKKAMEWRRLGEMPDPARFSHEVTVLEGQLYVFGGKKYYGINDTLNSVYRYDPLQNSWERLAEMQEKRCSFSVVVLDGKIYAIGGHCDPDYIESVEQYCPIANSWSYTWPLDLPLSAHVAKILKGQIFVSGGLSASYQCLASMFLYHPETGSTYLANMAKPRAHHCMEILGECFYVAGGISSGDNMAIFDQLSCEVYNPAANSWTALTPLPVPHVGAGSAVLEGKFYVLGGYSQEDCSDTKVVHRYDPSMQRWENMGKMPGPNNDIRASLLCLPSHFRL